MNNSDTHRVVEYLKELSEIDKEIFKLTMELKMLRFKKNNLKEKISEYLKDADQPGVKYGDIIVLSKESTQTKKLKKKEKEEKGVGYLESIHVQNPKDAYNKLMDTIKGEKFVKPTLYIKKEKK